MEILVVVLWREEQLKEMGLELGNCGGGGIFCKNFDYPR